MRSVPPALLAVLLLLSPLSSGCGAGGRDAQDIAADFEGTVSPSTVERIVRDVDLSRAPLVLSVGTTEPVRFAEGEQQALEQHLRTLLADLEGDSVHVTQQVVEDAGADRKELTLTLEVRHGDASRYVPVSLELARAERRWVIARARVMTR